MLPTVNWVLNKSLDDVVDNDDDAQTYPESSRKEVVWLSSWKRNFRVKLVLDSNPGATIYKLRILGQVNLKDSGFYCVKYK